MTEAIIFGCKRCGKCCREMRGPMMGQLHGLSIMPAERSLFPAETVKPMFRFHPRAKQRRREVWMYQIDAESCPFYREEDQSCSIYGRRPQICRAYPFELRMKSGRIGVHEACPEVHRLKEMKASVNVPKFYRRAATTLSMWYDVNLRGTDVNFQRFDLKHQRWKGMMEGLTQEHMRLLEL